VILRRLVTRLREHEWLAVLIELLIVILGVLIGIQAANWNEARVEQQRQALLLEGFRTEMRDYSAVTRKLSRRALDGLAAFDAARARGEHPAPFFFRSRGSDKAPTSVWDVAQQSGLTDMVRPNLMFDIGFFYSELDGIGVKFVRYSEFVESQVLPRLDHPEQFYDGDGNLKPEFRQNMERLREWAADTRVTAVSADCLIKRFDAPKAPGPSCRPDYSSAVGKENRP
jgi:hypothetical protein